MSIKKYIMTTNTPEKNIFNNTSILSILIFSPNANRNLVYYFLVKKSKAAIFGNFILVS